jgi:hypothetical protein
VVATILSYSVDGQRAITAPVPSGDKLTAIHIPFSIQ